MESLGIRSYFSVIRRRWAVAVLVPILAAVLSAVLSMYLLQPKYEADATLLVTQNLSGQQTYYDTIMANQALVNTYSDIIQSKSIELSVIHQLHLPYSIKQFSRMVTTTSPNQSLVIEIHVIDPSQTEAVNIANALTTTFQIKAQSYMNIQNVQIIDPASVVPAAHPVQPNKTMNVAVAFLLGLVVGLGLAFGLEYLDTRIRTEEAAHRILGVPVLGLIPDFVDQRRHMEGVVRATPADVSP